MERINWNKIVDGITVFMLGIVLLILVVCTVVLLSFDSLVGTGSMMVFTNQHVVFSSFISLATTGMTIALAFMAYLAGSRGYNKTGAVFGVAAAIVAAIDVYFDSLTADWLRYGIFVAIQNLPIAEQNNHILFRVLIGGMSLIGEPLAVAIIVGMPELKGFIRSVLPKPTTYPQSTPNTRKVYEQQTIERMNAARQRQPDFTPTYPPVLIRPDKKTVGMFDDEPKG